MLRIRRKGQGTILVKIKGRVIKRIPEKYEPIIEIIESRGESVLDYLEYEDRKWLQPSERHILKTMLLQENLKSFIGIAMQNPKYKGLINFSEPVKVQQIITRNTKYFAVKFAGGHELKCPAELYWGSPIKEVVRRLY
ncbi:hypothetical protein [Mangrovibacterium sp.]|uniref:hypothetical protein n=1 Tax=Mangrovibacterium sp. TaxID=1961364 RepID=UPI0035631FE1